MVLVEVVEVAGYFMGHLVIYLVEVVEVAGYYIGHLVIYFSIILLITHILQWLYKRYRKIDRLDLLPGPKTLPLLGNALRFCVADEDEYFKEVTTRICTYPCGITRVWNCLLPFCMIYKASKVETILNSLKHIDKSAFYDTLHPWLGTGLLTSTGSKWQHRRKMLTPAFHFKILEDFIDVFNQQSSKFISVLKEKANGTPFNILPLITLCTLDIILESTMGRSINAQDDANSEYVKAVKKITLIVVKRQSRPWLRVNLLFKLLGYEKEQEKCLTILHGFSKETIRERRKEYQLLKNKNFQEENGTQGKRKRLAFLDLLLDLEDEGDALSDEDIREEVDTFMFEGHDTTATAINWTIYLLGSYPDIQKNVHEELDSIFDDSDRPATSADLQEMKYLEYCIKETMRIFPSVPYIGRKIREDVTVDGYVIPSGTGVYINQYCLHRDPQYFLDPEEFIPERFSPENAAKRHPHAYIPFSAGSRNCIGQKFAKMELKVVLSSFFRKYRVESVVKREDIRLKADLILRPLDGMLVKLYPRK